MVDAKKWQQFTLAQQLGNIGSEISRARHWEEKKDFESRNNALKRALELLDLTIADKRWSARLKEILQMREVVSDWLSGEKNFEVTIKQLEEYCVEMIK